MSLYPLNMMNAAAPKGRPRGGSVTKFKKKALPAVPLRGPEAGDLRVEYDFFWFRNEFDWFMFVFILTQKAEFWQIYAPE
jgi:hypothetical protein